MLDGPATRPKTPLAVENSVGKPAAAREGVAPYVGMGKRDWRTPIPHFRARRSRFGGTGGHVCFWRGLQNIISHESSFPAASTYRSLCLPNTLCGSLPVEVLSSTWLSHFPNCFALSCC